MTACVRKVSEETELQCWNCVTTLTAQNHMTRGHGVKDECSIWENRLSFLSGGELNEHVGTTQTFLHCGYYIFKQATWGANKYIFVTFLIKLRQLFPSVSSLWAKLHIKAATTDFQLISAPPLDRGGSVSIASGRKDLASTCICFGSKIPRGQRRSVHGRVCYRITDEDDLYFCPCLTFYFVLH